MESKQNDLKNKIQAILHMKGEPVMYSELIKILEISNEEVHTLVDELQKDLHDTGTQIVLNQNECELVTSSNYSEILSNLQKQENEAPLTNAALETLSIVLYMGPIARSMIDFVRGVNSQYTLRSLLMRGLIQKDSNEKSTKYICTLDTIKFLGLNKLTDLPNYSTVKHSISQFIKDNTTNE